MLAKSEFGVGGLQSQAIFSEFINHNMFRTSYLSSFSSVIKIKITSPVTKSGEVYQYETNNKAYKCKSPNIASTKQSSPPHNISAIKHY